MTLLESEIPSLQADVASVLRRMRPAFAELIAALPGDVRRPADLKHVLEIDAKLGWQVFKIATTPDPIAASSHVPGRTSMKRFLDAAASRMVSPALIESASQAFWDFEEVVGRHADDRGSFDSMIRAIAGDESDAIDLQSRRAAYRANSRIWGLQARTKLSCLIVNVDSMSDAVDIATVHGCVDLRRFRRDASLIIASLRVSDDDDVVRRSFDRHPLDPDGRTKEGVSLLTSFCSRPVPKIHSTRMESGFVRTEVLARGVGNTSAVNLLMGEVSCGAGPRYRDEENRWFVSRAMIRQPVEVLIHDLLLHEDWVGPTVPDVLVFGDHRADMASLEDRQCDLLPLQASVMYLGRGSSVLHTPDVPNHPAMVRYAFDQLGWEQERFHVYRCRIEYPVMPSSAVLRFALPEAPSIGGRP
ncbi:MAG: hypothetical protein KAS72_08140 [Phycisphaerales bacterium]|nr:hypothetical protein [Phycisphaerales bacterium]